MSEALRQQSSELEPAEEPTPALAYADALPDLLPPVDLAPIDLVNDNDSHSAPQVGERIGFEIPGGIWGAMVACYGVFLTALLCATGGAHAAFVIVVSAGYVAMFFGLTKVVLRHGPEQPRSVLDRGRDLSTIYGPLARREVMAQMLVVPGAIAFFGIAVLIVRLSVA